MLTVLLTRHGETDRSRPEQYLGQRLEAHLTEAGIQAARTLGQRLDGVSIVRVLSSPSDRAVETARLVCPGAEVETDERLLEGDYGDWEGHTVEQIEAGWPEERRAWVLDPADVAIPGGESGDDVARRVRALLDELVAWEAALSQPDIDSMVLLVGHSTTNRVLLCISLGVPVRDYRTAFRQSWANLTVLRFDPADGPGAQLMLANDVSHLHGGGSSGITWEG